MSWRPVSGYASFPCPRMSSRSYRRHSCSRYPTFARAYGWTSFFSTTAYEAQAIGRAVRVDIGGQQVPFATAEDLILHKLFAGRPRDVEDIRGVVARKHDSLDWTYLERWAQEFAGGARTGADARCHRRVEVGKPTLMDYPGRSFGRALGSSTAAVGFGRLVRNGGLLGERR